MQDSNSNMAIQWTDDDKERLNKRYEVIIFQQNVKAKDLNDKGLPTDIHIVEYSQNGMAHSDVVRAMKMSDVFDVYHDKLREMGEGSVTAIKNGYGTIKPNMFQTDKKKDNK